MNDIKPGIEWKRLFLGIVLTFCGVSTIMRPILKLDDGSIATIVSGIPFVMLGSYFFTRSVEGIRKEKKEK